MAEISILALFIPQDFVPHGYCYLWDPFVLWLHVVSDALITLSYYCIPLILIYFIRRHRGIPLSRIFWMFGAFILACGTTHLMEIWNIWHASYLLSGLIKAATAVVSVITAAMLIPLIPTVMSLPGEFHLQEVNRKLVRELDQLRKFDAPSNTPLRRVVTAVFIGAVALTIVFGYEFWRNSRQAELEAYWVSHTHEVMETIQRTTRHVLEAVTSARAFALTGEEPLLAQYQNTRNAFRQDLDALRHLTIDNRNQQRRLDELEWRVGPALQLADQMIARRRKMGAAYSGGKDALETERLLDAVRAKTAEIYAEETNLLSLRYEAAQASPELTRNIAIPGALLSLGLWVLATLAIRREIKISEHARTQLAILNAELEDRVEQRTAALHLEIAETERTAEARARLAAVVESCDDAIVSKTLDGVITSWNRGAEKIFGYSATEVVGQPMLMLFPPELTNEEPQILAWIKEGRSLDHFETARVRKDGTRIDVSATISPVKDKDGAIVGVSNIARNITEQKRAERALAESLAATQAAVRELADQKFALDQHAIVAITNVQGTITHVNDKFCAISKYSREELLGQNHRILNSGHHPKEFFQQMYRTIANGQVWRGEIQNKAKDGSLYWVDTTIIPTLNADRKPTQYVAIRAVITERKQAEQKIRQLNEELEARVIQRTAELQAANEELEAFTYSVSHDLRAPLRHISGFSRILMEDFAAALPAEAAGYLHRIAQGAARMGQLVDELLNLTRIGHQALAMHPTELNPIVQDVITLLEPETKGREVDWEIALLPVVECDPTLVRQVFQNLIGNALKFTRSRPRPLIEIGQTRKDGQTVIFIRDNGVGFSMKYADKLFGVFQRLHRVEDFEGTGMGLATVQRIIQKHGGRIWAEAAVDQGATFYFALGPNEGAEESKRENTASKNAAAAGGQC